MTFPPRPGCHGLPDCDPPDPTFRILSPLMVAALIIVTDFLFFGMFEGNFLYSIEKVKPDTIPWVIGLALGSVLFTELYIYYARRPMTSEKPLPLRRRTPKGALYGFAIASVVFGPSVFIDLAVLEDIVFQNHLFHFGFRVVQFAACGIMIAHVLKKDPV